MAFREPESTRFVFVIVLGLVDSLCRIGRPSASYSNVAMCVLSLALLLSNAAFAADPIGPCVDKVESFKSPFSVACAGKSECLGSDQLEIRAVDTANTKPLVSVCLRIAGADDAVSIPLETYRVPGTTQVPLVYPLAPLFERWLHDDKRGAAMRKSPRAIMPVDVILVDKEGVRHKNQLVMDLSALWSNGSLPLEIESVNCASPCKFDSLIEIGVPYLGTWKLVTKNDPAKLNLVVNGTRLPNIVPAVQTAEGKGKLSYQLQRVADKPESALAWEAILKRTLGGQTGFTVGLADDKGIVANSELGGTFQIWTKEQRLVAIFFVAFLLAVTIMTAGSKTEWKWIRDSYSIPEDVLPAKDLTFSLGKCQMLWWTTIVVLAWFAIGLSTGNWFAMNDSALILLGISVGTATGAVAATPAGVTALLTAYVGAKTAAAGNAQDPALLAAAKALTTEQRLRSKDLLADLLSDYGESTGLHRLQSVLFTLVFGVCFLWLAFCEGAMPTLSTTVLALMGISGSAYVGFKLAGK